ncbi:MAG: helix-turn-helix domain-containing protein [Roseburia sp.]|nr:helix-turn-helix domain-containing protein [Roseburia sp.]MCM1279622.1 helix-turn-helix domain-containing protein [Robinsoniella sp.]
MDYGTLTLRIDDILKAKGISKNQICKLCHYLNVEIGELITYNPPTT